jgi:hypothetical protein
MYSDILLRLISALCSFSTSVVPLISGLRALGGDWQVYPSLSLRTDHVTRCNCSQVSECRLSVDKVVECRGLVYKSNGGKLAGLMFTLPPSE